MLPFDDNYFNRQVARPFERNLSQVAVAPSHLFAMDEARIGLDPDEPLAGAGIVRLPQPILIRETGLVLEQEAFSPTSPSGSAG